MMNKEIVANALIWAAHKKVPAAAWNLPAKQVAGITLGQEMMLKSWTKLDTLKPKEKEKLAGEYLQFVASQAGKDWSKSLRQMTDSLDNAVVAAQLVGRQNLDYCRSGRE